MCSNIAYSNRIDVLALLNHIQDYVLIKKDSIFPDYYSGSDIDLVVFDKTNCLKKITEYYYNSLYDKIEIKVTNTNEHCHIDFMFDDKIDLRIDLIDNFSFFQKLSIRPSFIVKLFMDRKSENFNDKLIYIPSDEDDLTLRYFEYLEWFDSNPDKIKHLEFICNVKDEDLKNKFFKNTHEYIHFEPKKWYNSRKEVLTEIKSGREALSQLKLSIYYIVYFIIRKFRRFFSKQLEKSEKGLEK